MEVDGFSFTSLQVSVASLRRSSAEPRSLKRPFSPHSWAGPSEQAVAVGKRSEQAACT